MKVGVTGHQARDGIDWDWVARSIRSELANIKDIVAAYSSLAAGTDQIFAEVALDQDIAVTAVIPLNNYERFFDTDGLKTYRRLLKRCEPLRLDWKGDEERAFFEAGRYIASTCNLMIAVWDGEEAEGLGGTADIISVAKKAGKLVVHINPISETIKHINKP